MARINIRWHQSIEEIPEYQWQELAGEGVIPFYKWEWLKSLEKSESIYSEKGWQPLHLALWSDNYPIAIAPLYLKSHSFGEFVFDQAFAQLANDLGLNYYPKLLGMSPLSPVEGYRFFFKSGQDKAKLTQLMMQIIDQFAQENGILSCNFLYVDPIWRPLAEDAGCSTWLNKQSLWLAEEKKDFSDYLNSFNSNQRRNIKRERQYIQKSGIKISALTGMEIDKDILNCMYDLYENHCARWGPWGSKYLSKSFFEELANPKQRNNIILFNAHRLDSKDPIAMSLCVTDGDMLWGRYWGSKEEIDYLHFEVCYYSPISWALDNKIKSFDPGAGGNHKQRRGFLAKEHASLHRWYDKTMSEMIKQWLPKANKFMINQIEAENNELPFKINGPTL